VVRDPEEEPDEVKRYRMVNVLILQWHLIGRIDDMMKLKFDRLSVSTNQPGTACLKVEWPKNIQEERDSPEQILIGANSAHLCSLLVLDGVYS
jgi:hypothetical protein